MAFMIAEAPSSWETSDMIGTMRLWDIQPMMTIWAMKLGK